MSQEQIQQQLQADAEYAAWLLELEAEEIKEEEQRYALLWSGVLE